MDTVGTDHHHIAWHAIAEDDDDCLALIRCTPERLGAQLELIASSYYEVLSLATYAMKMRDGTLPKSVVTFSFDDGLISGYNHAFPLLQEYGLKATFFPIACTLTSTGRLPPTFMLQWLKQNIGGKVIEERLATALEGRALFSRLLDHDAFDLGPLCKAQKPENRLVQAMFTLGLSPSLAEEILAEILGQFLSVDEINSLLERECMTRAHVLEMSKVNGIDFGSHTTTHPRFDVLSRKEAVDEFAQSGEIIKEIIGQFPQTAAWTYGGNIAGQFLDIANGLFKGVYNFRIPGMTPRTDHPCDILRIPEDECELFVDIL